MALVSGLTASLNAAGLVGVDVKTAFTAEATANGTVEDFDLPNGTRFNSLATTPGVTYESNITISGNPTSGLPVTTSFFPERAGTIVGTPFATGSDDGRMGYQIVFDSAQRWAGIQRYWSPFTVTQFYDENDDLLFEFTGEATPFVAFIADSANTNDWVKRIQIDGRPDQGTRQVGYSDDLMFGTSDFTFIPEPATSTLFLGSLVAGSFLRRRK